MTKLSMSEEEMLKRKYTRPYEKRIAELEKENAELKEAKETLATMNNSMWVELEKKRAESQGITNRLHQLIKAKELLERFLGLGNLWDLDCKDYFPLRKEAEQFLNEVEK